jgi:acetyltransferase EpsM
MRDKRKVVVLGASGHGKVVASTLLAAGWQIVGYFDDDVNKAGKDLMGIPVIGRIEDALHGLCLFAVAAIGRNQTRKSVVEGVGELSWAQAVHPTAWLDPTVQIGEGSVVFGGVIVQPGARIGRHCILNTGCTVDHDCILSDYVHLGPGVHLAGNVAIGEGAFLGIGTQAIPGVSVGCWSQVGAGGVIVLDIPDHVLAVGVPARVVRHLEEE